MRPTDREHRLPIQEPLWRCGGARRTFSASGRGFRRRTRWGRVDHGAVDAESQKKEISLFGPGSYGALLFEGSDSTNITNVYQYGRLNVGAPGSDHSMRPEQPRVGPPRPA